MKIDEAGLRALCAPTASRYELWIELLRAADVESMAEIGVYRGKYASEILAGCSSIRTYYMVDPWRHLDDWNKPANKDDDKFAAYLAETKARTDFAGDKRVFLRGRTTEVIDRIPDESLDFVYIDGDHTLRGISIDLVRVFPKVRRGGWIGGDDFTPTMWQHRARFEPTLVFPFAVYFAEAVGQPIFGLPHSQFLIQKVAEAGTGYAFADLTGTYARTTLQEQFRPDRLLRQWVTGTFSPRPLVKKLTGNVKGVIRKVSSG
jgi:Methyltransferase domain